jgi:hypothetical protein
MKNLINQAGVSRRRFLQVSSAGVVTATALGSGLITPRAAFAEPYSDTFTWISPRGTVEVMDDYAIWVAQEMGYFGDLGVDVPLSMTTWPSALIHRGYRIERCVMHNSSPRSSGSLRITSASMACVRSGTRCGEKALILRDAP